MLIGGEWRLVSGEPVCNPADGKILGRVPHATETDLQEAVEAAEKGFAVWRRMSPLKRSEIILRAVRIVHERLGEMAETMTLEQGKPIGQARLEIVRGCEFLEWDATEGRRMYGRIVPSETGMRHAVVREPVGIVAAFSPWNFPMSSPARKIGGALSAGCAMVLKASEETPGSAVQLAKAFVDAGLPSGVLNVVFGKPDQISEYLIPHPAVRMISFTGSVAVGKKLTALAGRHMKPAIMELGGHAPVIVCDDVDPVAVADASVTGKSRNAGQVCTAPTRFFVANAAYGKFRDRFVEKANAIKLGDGLDPETQMGPLANHRRVEALEELIADAVGKGAQLLCGGKRVGNGGNFLPLTVLAEVPDDARVMSEEPFGPLALINPVASLDEGIQKANSIPYGLAGYAFTNSARAAAQIADRLEVGNLSINHFTASVAETPFGGVKDSGFGREGGCEGLAGYTIVKSISHLSEPV